MAELRGTFAVLATPFNENEGINYSGLEHNINWNLEKGVHGIIPLGSTGEFTTLSKEESKELLNFVIKEVDGRVPIIAGTSADSTAAVIEKSKYAEAQGVDGLLILPPYYFNPLQEEMVNHYSLIDQEVNIPVMVYNNPGVTGVDIQLETVLEISKKENINYIKESTGDITRLRDIENGTDDIITFCGCDELALESFFAGAQGWVSVISNAFPGLSAQLFEVSVDQKDYEKAREIYAKLLPFCKELEGSGKLVQIIKYLMDKRGAVGGFSKQPKLPLTKEDKYRLDQLLERVN